MVALPNPRSKLAYVSGIYKDIWLSMVETTTRRELFAPVGRYRRGWNVIRAYGCLASVSLLHTLSSKHRFTCPCPKLSSLSFFFFSSFLFPLQPIPRLFFFSSLLSLSLGRNVCFGVDDPRKNPFFPSGLLVVPEADELVFTDLLRAMPPPLLLLLLLLLVD